MIIENGTIEVKHKTGGGIDPETGYPISPASASWGTPIPCQYSPIKMNLLERVSGEHVTAVNYSILIELMPFTAEQVRLKDRLGNEVGEYSIISIEPLEAVGQLKLTV